MKEKNIANNIINSTIKTENSYFELKNKEQGITLVALVITIIILIILATVAINFAFGNNGLIQRAEDARDYYVNDTSYTDESITNVESYLNDIIGGNGGSSSGAKTLVQAFNDGEIKVGDYVNYTPEAHEPITVGTSETGYTDSQNISGGTDQTFSQNANTTWRVLGLSEDGQHLLLTSGSPIKKDGKIDLEDEEIDDPYLVLESYIGADNCVNVLNKISSLYHNSSLADETRSMTIEDIENVVGDMTVVPSTSAGNDGYVYLTSDESKTPIGQASPYPSYTYESGDYTLTNPPQNATAGNSVEADAWMFLYTTEIDGATRAEYIDETVYDMLFKDTTGDANYAKSYWLASPGVRASSSGASFGPGYVGNGVAYSGTINLFDSNGYWYAGGFAVRPVVVLKSNITVEQIQVIEDQTEETWNTTGGMSYGASAI